MLGVRWLGGVGEGVFGVALGIDGPGRLGAVEEVSAEDVDSGDVVVLLDHLLSGFKRIGVVQVEGGEEAAVGLIAVAGRLVGDDIDSGVLFQLDELKHLIIGEANPIAVVGTLNYQTDSIYHNCRNKNLRSGNGYPTLCSFISTMDQ